MTYRIGEFARLSGVSAKTLRFYDETGILRPARVDARTRYRYYCADQLQDLAFARAFRQAGVPIAHLKRIMKTSRTSAQRRAVLERLHLDLQRSMEQTMRSMRWVRAMLDASAKAAADMAVVLKPRPAFEVVSLRAELDAYEDVLELERELLSAVRNDCRGAFRAVLWHRCAADGALDAEPVIELKQPLRLTNRHGVKRLQATNVASAYSAADDASAERTYDAIRRWMQLCGYELAGAKCEIDHGGLLEIQFPVRAAAIGNSR